MESLSQNYFIVLGGACPVVSLPREVYFLRGKANFTGKQSQQTPLSAYLY